MATVQSDKPQVRIQDESVNRSVGSSTPSGLRVRLLCMGCIATPLLVAVALFRSQYQVTLVVGRSMQPTFRQGDLLLVDKSTYRKAGPQRGDVVVVHYGADLILKRIVGLPGEEVEIRNGTLFINGIRKEESYPVVEGGIDVGAGKLASGDFATLGDNRSIPERLAIHPIVAPEDIVSKVVLALHLPLPRREAARHPKPTDG